MEPHQESGWWVCGPNEVSKWLEKAGMLRNGILPLLRGRGLMVDVGANIGIYTKAFIQDFDRIVAFEPFFENRDCFSMNVTDPKVSLEPYALDYQPGRFGMTGNKNISKHLCAGDTVEARTLDSFGLSPDFVKIDAEGFDLRVLVGAKDTLEKYRPVVLVENKPGAEGHHPAWYHYGQIDAFMESIGARLVKTIKPDEIYIWLT